MILFHWLYGCAVLGISVIAKTLFDDRKMGQRNEGQGHYDRMVRNSLYVLLSTRVTIYDIYDTIFKVLFCGSKLKIKHIIQLNTIPYKDTCTCICYA